MVMSSALRRRLFGAALLLCGVFAGSGAIVGASGSTPSPPRAHAAASLLVGVADEHTEVFSDPLWRRLHTRITRYIVPYDVVAHPASIGAATTWIHEAEAQHQQILVAFYHSEYTPTRMPSAANTRTM